MKRKVIAVAAVCAVAVGGCGACVWWGLSRTPDFYVQAASDVSDPTARVKGSKQFVRSVLAVAESVKSSQQWSAEFTAREINGWFAEELHQKFPEWLPDGVSDPRVGLSQDCVELGFRFERDNWSGIVSLRVKPWVCEPNQLAIQVESIQAGIIPMPLDEVLQKLTAHVERSGWRIEWRRSDSHNVAVVHLSRDKSDEAVVDAIAVVDGAIRFSGTGPDEPAQSHVAGP